MYWIFEKSARYGKWVLIFNPLMSWVERYSSFLLTQTPFERWGLINEFKNTVGIIHALQPLTRQTTCITCASSWIWNALSENHITVFKLRGFELKDTNCTNFFFELVFRLKEPWLDRICQRALNNFSCGWPFRAYYRLFICYLLEERK